MDPVVARHAQPQRVHAFVSADPSVAVDGTELPVPRADPPSLRELVHAVSAVCRAPMSALGRRGRARTLFLACAAHLTDAPHAEIAAWARVHRTQVARAAATAAERAIVARVWGAPRFGGFAG